MKIVRPDNVVELVKRGFVDEQATPSGGLHRLQGSALNTLQADADLARHPEIYPLVVEELSNKEALGFRVYAAKVLHKIGDPLGILHLTYNSLSTHPLLKVRQDTVSGWSDITLLRNADGLTNECIELLIKELDAPNGYLHVDVLSTLSSEKIVPRMLPLLEAPEKTAMAVAYILAMKGIDVGRSVLEKQIESQKHVELALIALSHIPDDKTLHYFRAYADPEHPIYRKYRGKSIIDYLLLDAKVRLFFLECRDPHPMVRTLERYYLRPIQELMAYARESTLRSLNDPKHKNSKSRFFWEEATARWIYPPLDFNSSFFVVNSHLTSGVLDTGVSAPDFLCEFSTVEDRVYCAEIQRDSIRALLSLETIDWTRVGNGDDMGVEPKFLWGLAPSSRERNLKNYYVPGFEITYEPEDYERSATEWILEPQKYRFGSYRPLVDYEPSPKPEESEWREYVKFVDPNPLRRISKSRGRKRGTDIVNSLPLLPPETFFRPFGDLKSVDPFASFDRKSSPMYDEDGYLISPDTGAKFYARVWRKRDYGDPNKCDLSISVMWESSEQAAAQYQTTLVKRTASASQPFSQLMLATCDALVSRTYQLNESESILQLVARYKNYVFNLVVSIKPEGYFPSTEAFVPYALAFDQHVASILSKAV